MKMFRLRKVKKAEETLVSDVKIIIPSAENFFAHYRNNILKTASRIDAEQVLKVDELQRFQYLINNFDTIASDALVNALIDAGYKKEGKKWTIKNWF